MTKKDRIILAAIMRPDGDIDFKFDGPVWDDPAARGIFFVDLMQKVAEIYTSDMGLDKDETIARILAGMDAELQDPTH